MKAERTSTIRLDEVRITLPIVDSRKSDIYALILTDSAGVYHYFNPDGTYDGCSADPHIEGNTGISLN